MRKHETLEGTKLLIAESRNRSIKVMDVVLHVTGYRLHVFSSDYEVVL